jgi:hypothetical protein
MLINPPPLYRKRPGRVKQQAPLVLTGASYNSSGLYIVLQFDRAVNSAGLNGTQIRVDDQPDGSWYLATGTVIVVGPNSIRVLLTLGGSTSGSADLLNAGAGNGIVAANDGGAWAGVTNFALSVP